VEINHPAFFSPAIEVAPEAPEAPEAAYCSSRELPRKQAHHFAEGAPLVEDTSGQE
jgi:hypothetical protein